MDGLKIHFSLYKELLNFENLWKVWKGFNAIISKLVINEFSTLSIWIFEDYFLLFFPNLYYIFLIWNNKNVF